mmetsp:Transcript_15173/g.23989  ORF Transcript_15173/g.23989 Transcript_15173/m.23989 type:complete len:204 (-) Transcript_15173:1125-1736(-)
MASGLMAKELVKGGHLLSMENMPTRGSGGVERERVREHYIVPSIDTMGCGWMGLDMVKADVNSPIALSTKDSGSATSSMDEVITLQAEVIPRAPGKLVANEFQAARVKMNWQRACRKSTPANGWLGSERVRVSGKMARVIYSPAHSSMVFCMVKAAYSFLPMTAILVSGRRDLSRGRACFVSGMVLELKVNGSTTNCTVQVFM